MVAYSNQAVPAPRSAWTVGGSNLNGTIFPSVSRADNTAYTSEEIVNPGARGVRLYIAIGTIGTTTLTVKIQVKNPVDDGWVDLPDAVTTALTANDTTTTLTVYPGVDEDANVEVSSHLGPVWRVIATLNDGDTNNVTFSVGADYLV